MTRALVLGGGGPVGIAWESGLVAGLAQGGVDLGRADFTMGTSAGSFVGARLAFGADAKTFADLIIADRIPGDERRPAGGGGPPPDLSKLMQLMGEAQGGVRNPAEVRAEIGAFALSAQTMTEDAFIESFGHTFSSLPTDAWPERGFACTAVDAETGAFQLWTKESGVGVTRAVAALAEQTYDEKGLCWPRVVAPADVHVVATGKDDTVFTAAEALAAELEAAGVRVMYDDRRAVSPGVKFKDAELIGVPTIVIVGKGLADGTIELRDRKSDERRDVPVADAARAVIEAIGA